MNEKLRTLVRLLGKPTEWNPKADLSGIVKQRVEKGETQIGALSDMARILFLQREATREVLLALEADREAIGQRHAALGEHECGPDTCETTVKEWVSVRQALRIGEEMFDRQSKLLSLLCAEESLKLADGEVLGIRENGLLVKGDAEIMGDKNLIGFAYIEFYVHVTHCPNPSEPPTEPPPAAAEA